MIDPQQIRLLIEQSLTDCTALIESPDGVHFSAAVISPDFAEKTRVRRQQMVYAPLNALIHDGSLHALSVKTFTPEEWRAQPQDNRKG